MCVYDRLCKKKEKEINVCDKNIFSFSKGRTAVDCVMVTYVSLIERERWWSIAMRHGGCIWVLLSTRLLTAKVPWTTAALDFAPHQYM